jgi:peptidoglycan/LPS O-acetylase OafA/YrhL
VRGLAIALVLWHHLVEAYLPVGPASWLGWLRAGTSLSWSGVDLFFVLSGFFIGGILIDHRNSPRLAATFYVRRAVRILPLYYVTLVLCLVLVAAQLAGPIPAFPAWVYALFLTNIVIAWQNFWGSPLLSPLWSIAVEEQFYLTAPWVVRWLPVARLPVFLVALVVIAWLLRICLYLGWSQSHGAIHALMPLRMDTLALGALLAWGVRADALAAAGPALACRWPLWLAATGLLMFALTVCHYLGVESVDIYVGYSTLGLAYAFLLVLLLVAKLPWLVRFFSLPPLVLLGRYSYFVYLWHMIIGWGIVRWLGGGNFVLNSPRAFAILALAVGATVLASLGSWKVFEYPLLKLGRRLSY